MLAPAPMVKWQSFKPDGSVNAGGSVELFDPGLSTPKDAYKDPFRGEVWAQPIVLDASGMPTPGSAGIYLDGAYRVVIKDSSGVTLYDMDSILGVNDEALQQQGAVEVHEWYAVGGGTANAHQVSIPEIVAYADGLRIIFRALNNNSGSATLRVNALAAKAIVKPMDSGFIILEGDDIIAGMPVAVCYNSQRDQFILRNPSSRVPTAEIKVSADDATTGNLTDKIIAASPITISVLNNGGDEQLQVGLNPAHDADTVDGHHAGTAASNVLVLDGSGKVPSANLPAISTLTAGSLSATAQGGGTITAFATYLPVPGNIPVAGTTGMLAYPVITSFAIERGATRIPSENVLTMSEFQTALGVPRLDASAKIPVNSVDLNLRASGLTYDIIVADSVRLGGTSAAGYQLTAAKGQVNGYASLDANGDVPLAQLPSTGINATTLNGQTEAFYAKSTDAVLAGAPTAAQPANSDDTTRIATANWVRNVCAGGIVNADGSAVKLPVGWSVSKLGGATGTYQVVHPGRINLAVSVTPIHAEFSNPIVGAYVETVSQTQFNVRTFSMRLNRNPEEMRADPRDTPFMFTAFYLGP